MIIAGELLRAFNVSLIILYLPVLYARLRAAGPDKQLFLGGVGVLLIGLASGSAQAAVLHMPLRFSTCFITVGLLCIVCDGIKRIVASHRTPRK